MATQQETTNPAGERENNEIQALCLSAFEAERQKNWKLAFDLHNQSITRLNSIIAKQTGWFTNETKRIAQKQTKFHAVRRDFIRGLANGVPGAKEPVLLPTHQSAVESLMEVKPDGTRTISSDEILLINWKALKAQNPTLAAPPEIAALESTAPPPPFYTPTLDAQAPETLYHIYNSATGSFLRGVYIYFKARDATDSQVQYVLQAFKANRYQITRTSFHRSSQFANPSIVTNVNPIKASQSDIENMFRGRPFKHFTTLGSVIEEIPDRCYPRPEKAKWTPRRFSYGGRRFVWKSDKMGSWSRESAEALYEVKKEWPLPGSKTGKKGDECFTKKLAWTELKMGMKKVAILHVAGGVDQVFREFILASWMTREMVMLMGSS